MKRTNSLPRTLFLIFLAVTASAQSQDGQIHGVVTGPFDGIVSNAPTRAMHIASGNSWQMRTDANGRYKFDGLPAGDYYLQVSIRCCEYVPYKSEPVELRDGAERGFNIQLRQGFQLNTIGDDGGIATAKILAQQDFPDRPSPETTDGKPHLAGMWMYGSDPFPPAPKFTDWAAKLVAERIKNHFIESPRIHCLPTALPIPTHTPPTFGKFLHTPDLIVILYEGVLGYRQIFMDGRGHPEDIDPSWLGHSVGRWEDDVLVVDTIGFNDRGWTGLTHPRSEDFHVIERYRRTSYGDMELELTIEDPAVYKEPWVQQIPIYLTPDEHLFEFVCENESWVTAVNE
jgi:hypothetical protein